MTSFGCPWATGPGRPVLGDADIHVWCAPLDLASAEVELLARTLDPSEGERAARYRFERDRRRFVVRRGVLRRILGRYLGEEPGRLEFTYGPQGKPALGGAARRLVNFNLSHSGGIALYAFAAGADLGVDVEHLKPLPDADQVSERFFSRREHGVYQALTAHQKVRGFYNCWTRKEAFVKAPGHGLSHPLDRFEVSLVPGEEARVLSVDGDAGWGALWFLREVEPGPGFVGALAAEGSGWQISHWRYEDHADAAEARPSFQALTAQGV